MFGVFVWFVWFVDKQLKTPLRGLSGPGSTRQIHCSAVRVNKIKKDLGLK